MGDVREAKLECSFCGKNQKEVKKLIAGPGTYICNECVALCNDIIAEEIVKELGEASLPTNQRSVHERLAMIHFSLRQIDDPLRWIVSATGGRVNAIPTLAERIESLEGAVRAVREVVLAWPRNGPP